jgi:Tol biopolymer transport system component
MDRILVVGIAIASAACDQLWNLEHVTTRDGGLDALGPWGAPVPVPGNPTGSGDDPTFSADQLELYFETNREIMRSTRPSIGESWSTPQLVVELSDPAYDETTPELSTDGLTMMLVRRPAGSVATANDIWMTTRASHTAPWDAPIQVAELASSGADTDPVLALDGQLLFFSRQPAGDDADIYQATRDGLGTWSSIEALSSLNTIGSEGSPFPSADALTLYMSSSRSGGFDLFEATRPTVNDAFSTPSAIVELTTADEEHDIWVSPDGRTIYFIRVVGGANALWMAQR